MPKAEADNEISIKSFQKLVDQINNIENKIEKINTEILDLKNTLSSDQKHFNEQVKNLEIKSSENKSNLFNSFKKIKDEISIFQNNFDENIKKVNKEQSLSKDDCNRTFQELKDTIISNQKNLSDSTKELNDKIINNKKFTQEIINTKEEIILSKIDKINDQFLKNFQRVTIELEEAKNELDTLKISFTVDEKKLLETIQTFIKNEMVSTIKSKEILMKNWIKELKEIISEFENLKKLQPKEFSLQIQEIISTIDMFKKRL